RRRRPRQSRRRAHGPRVDPDPLHALSGRARPARRRPCLCAADGRGGPAPAARHVLRALGARELAEWLDLVGLAGASAEDEHRQALRAGVDLALGLRADANEDVLLEIHALAFDIDPPGAAEGQVDLLLAIGHVVVLRVVAAAGWEADHLDAEGAHAQLGARLD